MLTAPRCIQLGDWVRIETVWYIATCETAAPLHSVGGVSLRAILGSPRLLGSQEPALMVMG